MHPEVAHENKMAAPNFEEDIDEPVPVAVAVRLKGQNEGQGHGQGRGVIINHKNGELSLAGASIATEKFKFDHILPENTPQSEVYSRVLAPFLPLVFDGFDLFVLTHGGSGCGKTFTLFGPDAGPLRSESDLGLIPRFVRHIFEYFNEADMVVKASSFDVTNDDICDLLVSINNIRPLSCACRKRTKKCFTTEMLGDYTVDNFASFLGIKNIFLTHYFTSCMQIL